MPTTENNANAAPQLTEAERKVLDRIKEESKLKQAQQIVRKLAQTSLLIY